VSQRNAWEAVAGHWAELVRGDNDGKLAADVEAFFALLPPPGRRTLDLGCGEGRVGAELERCGHVVVGVDSSPAMVEMARERHEAVVGDAGDLPFEDGSFDLVVAYMSVMNLDDPEGGVREAARVLSRGGRMCIAVVHPIDGAGAFEDRLDVNSDFVIRGSYFEPEAKLWESDRGGIRVTFFDRALPLERLVRACEDAGLVVDAVREPRPSAAFIRANPLAERRLRIPLFLHLRAVKP